MLCCVSKPVHLVMAVEWPGGGKKKRIFVERVDHGSVKRTLVWPPFIQHFLRRFRAKEPEEKRKPCSTE